MSKKKTFRVYEEEESRELIKEETLDEAGNMISYMSNESPETTEGFYEYDERGNMISEREIIDGAEASKLVFEYDEKGNLIHTKQYVADEIFEEVIHEYSDNGVIMRKMRFGDEIERKAETKNGDTSIREVFEDGELSERQKVTFEPASHTYFIEVEDPEGNPKSTMVRIEDESGNLLKEELKNLKGQMLANQEYKYDQGLLIYEKHENHLKGYHFEVINEYNENKQQISTETRSLAGHLIEFEKTEYDNQGRAIVARGVSRIGEKYVLEYEYE